MFAPGVIDITALIILPAVLSGAVVMGLLSRQISQHVVCAALVGLLHVTFIEGVLLVGLLGEGAMSWAAYAALGALTAAIFLSVSTPSKWLFDRLEDRGRRALTG